MSRLTNFIEQLCTLSNPKSSKSFALLVSTLTGGLMALCICFALVYDVCSNGHIVTDLGELGLFLLCIGGYIAGSGAPKIFSEKYGNRAVSNDETTYKKEKEREPEQPSYNEPLL